MVVRQTARHCESQSKEGKLIAPKEVRGLRALWGALAAAGCQILFRDLKYLKINPGIVMSAWEKKSGSLE